MPRLTDRGRLIPGTTLDESGKFVIGGLTEQGISVKDTDAATDHALTGSMTSAATLAGSTTAARKLTGAVSGTGAMTGEPTYASGAVDYPLDGTISSTSALTGVAGIDHYLEGTATGTGAGNALLSVGRALAGSASSDSSLTADADIDRSLSGTASGAGVAAGEPALDRSLAGESVGAGTLTGDATWRQPWYKPDSITVVYGSVQSGTIDSVWENDGTNLVLTENTGADAFAYDFEFNRVDLSIIDDAEQIHVDGYYSGNPAHVVKFAQWNYTTQAWTDLTAAGVKDMPSSASEQHYAIDILTSTDYVDTGARQIRIRLYHASNGSAGHLVYLDNLYLSNQIEHFLTGTVESAGTITGAATLDHDLTSSMAGAGSLAGEPTLGRALAGSCSAAGSLAGEPVSAGAPDAPAWATLELSGDDRLIEWAAVEGATSYLVYVSVDGGECVLVEEVLA